MFHNTRLELLQCEQRATLFFAFLKADYLYRGIDEKLLVHDYRNIESIEETW